MMIADTIAHLFAKLSQVGNLELLELGTGLCHRVGVVLVSEETLKLLRSYGVEGRKVMSRS